MYNIYLFFSVNQMYWYIYLSALAPNKVPQCNISTLNNTKYIDYLVAEGFVLYIWQCNFLVIFPRLLNNVKFLLRIFCDVLLCSRVNECGFHTCEKIKRLHFFNFPQYYFLTSCNQKLNLYTSTVVIDTSRHGLDKINDENLEYR